MANTKVSLEVFINLRKKDLAWYKERLKIIEHESSKAFLEGKIEQLEHDLSILESILNGEM